MRDRRLREREAAEDVFFGQVVIIWARWFLIAAAAVFALGTAKESSELALAMLPIVGLMAVNCYLHGRFAMERPANTRQIVAASAVDLVAITSIVLFWSGGAPGGTGIASPFFIFYYPLLLGFAFVLPRRAAASYAGVTLAAYAATCLIAPLLGDAPAVASPLAAKALVLRLATLAAVAALGSFYWRIQRERRARPEPVAGA